MSDESIAGDNPGREPPSGNGWRLAAEVRAGNDDGLTIVPSSGGCSLTYCFAPTTAAVRRRSSGLRANYWQAYCADHARERGVESGQGSLEWADGFVRRYDGSPRSS